MVGGLVVGLTSVGSGSLMIVLQHQEHATATSVSAERARSKRTGELAQSRAARDPAACVRPRY
jgi:hypothetical protein